MRKLIADFGIFSILLTPKLLFMSRQYFRCNNEEVANFKAASR